MALFDGTENFTPAFTGQQIANQTGAGAASAFTGGMNAGTSQKHEQLQEKEFDFKKKQYSDQLERLDLFKQWLDRKTGGNSYGWGDQNTD